MRHQFALIIERFPDCYRQPKLIAINTNNVMKQPDPEPNLSAAAGGKRGN